MSAFLPGGSLGQWRSGPDFRGLVRVRPRPSNPLPPPPPAFRRVVKLINRNRGTITVLTNDQIGTSTKMWKISRISVHTRDDRLKMLWSNLHKNITNNQCCFGAHMKALNMLFQMRYSRHVCYKKCLGDSQRCGAHLHEAGSTQKYA